MNELTWGLDGDAMFTGIIQAVGSILAYEPRGGDLRLHVGAQGLDMASVALGDSIATNGVCLTVVEKTAQGFWSDVSGESMRLTTLGNLGVGARVNLEKAVTPATHLGGHIVSGHVDGLGKVLSRQPEGRSQRFRIQAPDELARYIAKKGSICVDGISLTVNEVDGACFDLNIVPHTLGETTLAGVQAGALVNLEVDVIARYLERLLSGAEAARPEGGVSQALLAQNGFL